MSRRVNVRGIDDETRVRILGFLRERYGYRPLARMLGVSTPSLSRYLRGLRRVPDDVFLGVISRFLPLSSVFLVPTILIK